MRTMEGFCEHVKVSFDSCFVEADAFYINCSVLMHILCKINLSTGPWHTLSSQDIKAGDLHVDISR